MSETFLSFVLDAGGSIASMGVPEDETDAFPDFKRRFQTEFG